MIPMTPADEEEAFRVTAEILRWAYPLIENLKPGAHQNNKGIFAAATMLFTGSVAKEIKPYAAKADCKSGCTYCCYQMVQISPSEAFRIGMVLKDDVEPRLVKAAELLKEYNRHSVLEQRFRKGIPCVFLREKKCSIWPVRPTICASFLSIDVRKCKAGWEGRFLPEIPAADYMLPPQNLGISSQMALDFAFWKQGLQIDHWELSYAVLTAMQPGAFEAWLSGEPVFDPTRRFMYETDEKEGYYEDLMYLMDRRIQLVGVKEVDNGH